MMQAAHEQAAILRGKGFNMQAAQVVMDAQDKERAHGLAGRELDIKRDLADAESKHLGAQAGRSNVETDLAKMALGLGVEGRAIYENFIASRGEIPLERFLADLGRVRQRQAAGAVAPAGIPGQAPIPAAVPAVPTGPLPGLAPPTSLEARDWLAELMPDLAQIVPPDLAGVNPFEMYNKAMERGYGPRGLDDPHSELSQAFRQHLKRTVGEDAWRMGLLPSGNQSWWDWLWGGLGDTNRQFYRFQDWGNANAASPPLRVPAPPRVRVPAPPQIDQATG